MTDKSAIRAEALGQDFGADTAAFDPDAPVTEAVEQDHRGTVMVEFESYERIIEGMKLASDGARNMARFSNPEKWNKFADFTDQVRRAMIQLAGFDRPQDAKPSNQLFGGEGISRTEALSRIRTGLDGAAAGARQIAQAQRMDLRWQIRANHIDKLRGTATEMAKAETMRKLAAHWGGGSERLQ
jgi:hypothetical protein